MSENEYRPIRDYALIRSALHIAKAEALGPEEHAENQVERADKMEKAGQVSGGPPS